MSTLTSPPQTVWRRVQSLAGFVLGMAMCVVPVIAKAPVDGLADFTDDARLGSPLTVPEGVKLLRDIPYGTDPRQTLDVYLPGASGDVLREAPVLFMVHGGAWMFGDKSASAVVENKLARWVARGMVLVSVNYRLMPQAAPLEQARDVARALALAQDRALDWGGSRQRFVLMGHSAGAHLVALLAVSDALVLSQGGAPWQATVLLDSAALDVPRLMEAPHARFYDRVFGRDPQAWTAVSPQQQLKRAGAPLLAVCSARRADSCAQAQSFVTGLGARGTRAEVLTSPLSHRDINAQLGTDSDYTRAVEGFLKTSVPALARWFNDSAR